MKKVAEIQGGTFDKSWNLYDNFWFSKGSNMVIKIPK